VSLVAAIARHDPDIPHAHDHEPFWPAPLDTGMNLPVDADRLRVDLEANAAFGRIADDDPETHGRTNRTGTEANRAARDRLVERFEEAGLAVAVDAVGNLVGTWAPDSADPDAAPVASGSHLDSVPEGGIFDGPLGVYAALEAVRAMQDAASSRRGGRRRELHRRGGDVSGTGCSGRASRPE